MPREIATNEIKKGTEQWTFRPEHHRTVLMLCRAFLNNLMLFVFVCKGLSNINVLKEEIIPFHNSRSKKCLSLKKPNLATPHQEESLKGHFFKYIFFYKFEDKQV
jgi:hypothetical protein